MPFDFWDDVIKPGWHDVLDCIVTQDMWLELCKGVDLVSLNSPENKHMTIAMQNLRKTQDELEGNSVVVAMMMTYRHSGSGVSHFLRALRDSSPLNEDVVLLLERIWGQNAMLHPAGDICEKGWLQDVILSNFWYIANTLAAIPEGVVETNRHHTEYKRLIDLMGGEYRRDLQSRFTTALASTGQAGPLPHLHIYFQDTMGTCTYSAMMCADLLFTILTSRDLKAYIPRSFVNDMLRNAGIGTTSLLDVCSSLCAQVQADSCPPAGNGKNVSHRSALAKQTSPTSISKELDAIDCARQLRSEAHVMTPALEMLHASHDACSSLPIHVSGLPDTASHSLAEETLPEMSLDQLLSSIQLYTGQDACQRESTLCHLLCEHMPDPQQILTMRSVGANPAAGSHAALLNAEPQLQPTNSNLQRPYRWQQRQRSDKVEPCAAIATCSTDASGSPDNQGVMSAHGTAVTWPSQNLLRQQVYLAQKLQQPPPAACIKSSSSVTSSGSSVGSATVNPDRGTCSDSSEQHRSEEERAARPATNQRIGMSGVHKEALIKCTVEILDSLDVAGDVIHFLYREKIVTKELCTDIEDARRRQAKAKLLLDDLPSCGKTAFGTFLEALTQSRKLANNELAELLRSQS